MGMDGGREVLLRSRGESEHEDGEKKLNGPETPATIPPDRGVVGPFIHICDPVSTSFPELLFRFVPSGSCPYTSTFRRPTVHVRSSERTDSCGPPLASVFRTVLYCTVFSHATEQYAVPQSAA
jgi:hypothetical protein